MTSPLPRPFAAASFRPARLAVGILASALLLAGCGGGGGTGTSGVPGGPGTGPDGPFIVDPNQGGGTSDLRLVGSFWGRLVDIHDVDSAGNVNPVPVYDDFVIRENLFADGANYLLQTNAITQETRLVIRRSRRDDPIGFDTLLRAAAEPLSPVAAKNDNGTSSAPFSFVARNACLVLRFNDVLDDSPQAALDLAENVRVRTGYPPTTPFQPRVLFDPNHGALVGGRFHSTRVLIDLTVSETEAADAAVSLPLNSIGLPASLVSSSDPNVSIRIPTRIDFGSGQFTVLRALSGAPIGASPTEPQDRVGPTRDVVRAVRSGNQTDINGGFLLDLNQPRVVGSWPLRIGAAANDPVGTPGFDFLLDVAFDTECQAAGRVGDVIQAGDGRFFEIRANSSPPNGLGQIVGIRARSLAQQPIDTPASIISNGLFLSTYSPATSVVRGCWVNFSPQPGIFPARNLAVDTQVQVRFSEPMAPGSLSPFETFTVVRGDSTTPVNANNIVVGRIDASDDLRIFTFSPELNLTHQQGFDDGYSVRLNGPTDLAGNPLANALPIVDFRIDPDEPTTQNGGTVMRFDSPDEVRPIGFQDLRGQFFFDLDRGVISPRPVAITAVPADRSNPIPSIMVPFPPGVQTPLSPLGSKLQTVWRYVDLGWQVLDETRFNVDVFGLSWSPIGGQIISDFYPDFEIALSHSRRLPDEEVDGNLLPRFEQSGLRGRNNFFTDNILDDPLSPQKVVHPRSLGYRVDPVNIFLASTGTVLMPFPLNRGAGDPVTYTWRDTAVLSTAGPSGAGIPLAREVGPPLFLEDAPPGRYAPSNQVPSFGLPLLLEFRTYPNSTAIGLNAFDISLAINSSAIPSFRSYSTGGFNTSSQTETVEPDLELEPRGGFNPNSNPPGRRTRRADDNTFYVGQLDIITRISRVHTAWIDSFFTTPDYIDPVVQPSPDDQPPGTQVIFEYRGATGFDFDVDEIQEQDAPFDATRLNAYGEMFRRIPGDPPNGETLEPVGEVRFTPTGADWTTDIDRIDGAQYFQLRITFVNNIRTGLNPELSGIGFAYND